MSKSIQQRIVHSPFTCPLTVILLIALGVWEGLYTHGENLVAFFLLVPLNCWILLEQNNRFALIRTRTTFHISVYLCLLLLCPPDNPARQGLVGLCMLAALFFLFLCNEKGDRAIPHLFHLFFFISTASMLAPPVIWYIPLIFITLHLWQGLTLRGFLSGTVGFILPWWLLLALAVYQEDFSLFPQLLDHLTDDFCRDYSWFTLNHNLTTGFIGSLAACGFIGFVLFSFQDKLRTRQYLWFISSFALATLLIQILYPTYAHILLLPLSISAAILSAHLFVLSSSRFLTILFCFFAVCFFFLLWLNL